MYKALVQPLFDYCDLVWGNLNKGLADRLQKLQNRAARIITFQGYDARSADILQQLEWDRLDVRREKRLSYMIYDVHNEVSPPYLRDLFSKSTAAKNYKSKSRNIEYSFFTRIVKLVLK